MGETVEYGIVVTLASGQIVNETLVVDASVDAEDADDLVAQHVFFLLHHGVAVETAVGERAISPYNIASIEWVRPTPVLGA